MTLGDTAEDSNHELNIHVMYNMYWEALDFEIPKVNGLRWYRAIDTSLPTPNDISPVEDQVPIDERTYTLTSRSIVVLASRATS